jgi:hypothetical protein
MAWTELTRRQHAREGDKYASDLTDAEWASIAPFMPPPKTTGRPCQRRQKTGPSRRFESDPPFDEQAGARVDFMDRSVSRPAAVQLSDLLGFLCRA